MQLEDLQENYGSGWIRLYRSIKKHWIWQDPIKFQWWIDILLSVNHSGKKVNIGYDIFDCEPGQSIKSLKNWADEWNVSKDTVRNFFTLLKKDRMIIAENLKKTTRITVCNYDDYQSSLHAKQTRSKREANAKQTQGYPNKNDKKEKNVNNEEEIIPVFNFKNELLNLGVEKQIVEDWLLVRKNKKATNSITSLNKIKNQIKLSGITANECIKIAAEKDWRGFEAEWLKNSKTNGTQKKKLAGT